MYMAMYLIIVKYLVEINEALLLYALDVKERYLRQGKSLYPEGSWILRSWDLVSAGSHIAQMCRFLFKIRILHKMGKWWLSWEAHLASCP